MPVLRALRVWPLVIGFLAACNSPTAVPPIGEEVPPDNALIAVEAFRGEDRYFLRYQHGEEYYYAAGDLKGRQLLEKTNTGGYQAAEVNTLIPEPLEDWNGLRERLTPVPILGLDAWARFRERIFKGFMPTRGNSGVAVSFERGDYFFFYDRAGRFRARRLIDKPPWYEVVGSINLEQYYHQWQPLLLQFLAEEGVKSEEVLFNTGDLEAGAIPFIYINTRRQVIVLIRYDELPESMEGQIPAAHWLQSLWHFIGSHTYSVPMRPFTSAQSLIALLADTAVQPGRGMLSPLPRGGAIPPLSDSPGMDLVAWEKELDDYLGRESSQGKIDFLVDGDSFFPRFIDTVASAQTSVDIRAYIFDNDDVALTIAELLKRRSLEGIDTRVLFDGLGTIMAGGEKSASLPESHRTPISIHSYLEQNSDIDVRAVKNTWLMGDHVKTMIIDQRTAFLGGMNIGREYRYDWHDLMMEVTGPVVDEINREFNNAWAQAGWFGDFGVMLARDPKPINSWSGGYPLRLIHTRPGQQEIFNLQREAIRKANQYIYIENAYFTDDQLLSELIDARRRGVDVRVIIPLETDRGLITRNIATAANQMLEHGIRVYIYPGFTHAKAAIFDGWACVGSANFDRLSLKINREINVATSEPVAVQELLDELFLPDFEHSPELTEPFPQNWADSVIEMVGDYVF
ncbi:MAG: phosphatidylserine/phosphatidylglycerophosphate/cardiolipin synthase family protein [Halioglobus sp.]